MLTTIKLYYHRILFLFVPTTPNKTIISLIKDNTKNQKYKIYLMFYKNPRLILILSISYILIMQLSLCYCTSNNTDYIQAIKDNFTGTTIPTNNEEAKQFLIEYYNNQIKLILINLKHETNDLNNTLLLRKALFVKLHALSQNNIMFQNEEIVKGVLGTFQDSYNQTELAPAKLLFASTGTAIWVNYLAVENNYDELMKEHLFRSLLPQLFHIHLDEILQLAGK